MACNDFSVEVLKSLLSYRPDSGDLVWLVDRGSCKKGDIAGSFTHEGYRRIKLNGTEYSAHRIAWALTHGDWPKDYIDHIDGNKANNRLSNLREATNAVNQHNRKGPQKNNKLGFLGVYEIKSKDGKLKYKAQIKVDMKVRHIGVYLTPEFAHAAYLAEKRICQKGCTI